LLFLGVLPAALIAALLASYFVRSRMADLERSLQDRGDVLVLQIATSAAHGISSGNRQLLNDVVAAALQEDDVVNVEILDPANTPLAAARRTLPAQAGPLLRSPLRLKFSTQILAPADVQTARNSPPQTRPAARSIGTISLSMSHDQTLQAQRDTLLFMLRIGAGGLLLTAILAYRMGRTISAPILSLTAHMQQLSQGQLEARAHFPASRELADLRDGFNDMALELERHRDTLEQKVTDATRQTQETLADLERRNLELDAARRQAEAQTELKSQFLAHMSHEIRTPMNGIIGFTELMGQSELTPTQRSQLNLIERSARSLLGIINEVLDLSKLEAGRVALNPQDFFLRDYLEDAVSLVAPRSTRIPVILWISPEVPSRLVADPIRLQQVVNNLLSNALKSTNRGQVVIRVRKLDGKQMPRLLISVSDSGSGIPQREIGNLFFPFLQLSPYAINQERGTGLGLTIARNIIERMGGAIRVASREGVGTTFWFTLPLTESPTDVSTPHPADTPIVLVDVNPISAQATRFQLEAMGYAVHIIESLDHWLTDDLPEGPAVVIQTSGLENQSTYPLSWWLTQVHARRALPVLLLESVNERQEAHYRERGAICLTPPVRSENLRAVLRSIQPDCDQESAISAQRSEPASRPLRDLHFLVADDNEINRILLRAQLVRLGAEVDDARDGGEALEMLQIQPYDLVFLDLKMPVLHGLEVMAEVLKEPGPNTYTPVVAITAHAQPEQRQTLIDRGFADCLIKPIVEQTVLAAVEHLLHRQFEAPTIRPPVKSIPNRHAAVLLERSQGDHDIARSVAAKLFAELPEQLAAIKSALRKTDWQEAAHWTHKVHGTASFCGLEELRRDAKALETVLLDAEPWTSYQSQFESFQDDIQKLIEQAPAVMSALEPSNSSASSTV
jgi:two-component system sensor histidine kinase BarA